MPGKRTNSNIIQLVYYNHQIGKSAQELSQIFDIKLRTIYNITNRAENEDRIHLSPAGYRTKKLSDRHVRRILRIVDENPRVSLRSLAFDLQTKFDISVSHETLRKVLNNNNYSSRVARKKPLLSATNVEKRLKFASTHINYGLEYWNDVIFCDEVKIMMYYNSGPTTVWRKPLEAYKNKNIIPTVKFGKLSVMIWSCISSKGVGNLRFIDETMDQNVYLDILKTDLVSSAIKFGFVDPNNSRKLMFKFYQDNDPKHKSHLCRTWTLYNCTKVIDTPAQSPDLNPIENLWSFLKKKVGARQPTTKNQLKQYINEEWSNIPQNYDIKKLISSMKNRLQAVIDSKGSHTKY